MLYRGSLNLCIWRPEGNIRPVCGACPPRRGVYIRGEGGFQAVLNMMSRKTKISKDDGESCLCDAMNFFVFRGDGARSGIGFELINTYELGGVMMMRGFCHLYIIFTFTNYLLYTRRQPFLTRLELTNRHHTTPRHT